MIHYNPKDSSYHRIDLDFNMKIYNELLSETDSQPKNPPYKRLSKKEFYKLLEKEPWHLYTNVCDEIEERNSGKFIWLPLCKEALPLKEVMTLRERYFPDLFK